MARLKKPPLLKTPNKRSDAAAAASLGPKPTSGVKRWSTSTPHPKPTSGGHDPGSEDLAEDGRVFGFSVTGRTRSGAHPSQPNFNPLFPQRPSSSLIFPASRERPAKETRESPSDDDLPRSAQRSRPRRRVIIDDSEDENQDQGVDKTSPLPASIKRRRLLPRSQESSSLNATASTPGARQAERSLFTSSPTESGERGQTPSLTRPRLRHLSVKDKKREILRRRKAGEKISDDDQSSSSEEKRALYDSDSGSDHVALRTFDDDDEGVPAEQPSVQSSKTRGKSKRMTSKKGVDGSTTDPDDSFIEDDGALGVPDEIREQIPLSLTGLSHKPLQSYFEDVVLFLLATRLGRAYHEKQNPLYAMAWKKVDQETRGLASSRYASSVWKLEFVKALGARPEMREEALHGGDPRKLGGCGACGRSNHTASHVVWFEESPYYRKDPNNINFLEKVEDDSDSEDDDTEDTNDTDDEECDEDGDPIPPASTRWHLGSVCYLNARMAHDLLHWKYTLKNAVENWLTKGGHLTPAKIAERDKQTPKQTSRYAKQVLEDWRKKKMLEALWRTFEGSIEKARGK